MENEEYLNEILDQLQQIKRKMDPNGLDEEDYDEPENYDAEMERLRTENGRLQEELAQVKRELQELKADYDETNKQGSILYARYLATRKQLQETVAELNKYIEQLQGILK